MLTSRQGLRQRHVSIGSKTILYTNGFPDKGNDQSAARWRVHVSRTVSPKLPPLSMVTRKDWGTPTATATATLTATGTTTATKTASATLWGHQPEPRYRLRLSELLNSHMKIFTTIGVLLTLALPTVSLAGSSSSINSTSGLPSISGSSNRLTDTINNFVLKGVYNVKSYGAMCDGRADDTAAIQSTSTAACVAGTRDIVPEVYFPSGNCIHSKPLIETCSNSTLTWSGDSFNTATLTARGYTGPNVLIAANRMISAIAPITECAARREHRSLTPLEYYRCPNVAGCGRRFSRIDFASRYLDIYLSQRSESGYDSDIL